MGVTAARIADHAELFSEVPGRAVLCVDPEQTIVVLERLEQAGVPVARIGVAGGDRFAVKGLVDVALGDLTSAWTDRLPDALGSGTTQG
jgi:phosphoribosylformylglycinamidine (FGAM) synthase-like enzyme